MLAARPGWFSSLLNQFLYLQQRFELNGVGVDDAVLHVNETREGFRHYSVLYLMVGEHLLKTNDAQESV